jgi:hypothetical protein
MAEQAHTYGVMDGLKGKRATVCHVYQDETVMAQESPVTVPIGGSANHCLSLCEKAFSSVKDVRSRSETRRFAA